MCPTLNYARVWQNTSKCLSALRAANVAGSFKTRNCVCQGKYRWLPMEAADKAPSRKTRAAAYFLARFCSRGEKYTGVCVRSAVYDLEIRSASVSLRPPPPGYVCRPFGRHFQRSYSSFVIFVLASCIFLYSTLGDRF